MLSQPRMNRRRRDIRALERFPAGSVVWPRPSLGVARGLGPLGSPGWRLGLRGWVEPVPGGRTHTAVVPSALLRLRPPRAAWQPAAGLAGGGDQKGRLGRGGEGARGPSRRKPPSTCPHPAPLASRPCPGAPTCRARPLQASAARQPRLLESLRRTGVWRGARPRDNDPGEFQLPSPGLAASAGSRDPTGLGSGSAIPT